MPSLDGFLASNWGRIRRIKMPDGRVRPTPSNGTYGSVTRSKLGAAHSYMSSWYRDIGNVKIHRLVCEAFHGPAPFPRAVVIHLNEDAHDNRPENLKWGTQKENLNMPSFLEYCRSRTGENSPTTKSRNK